MDLEAPFLLTSLIWRTNHIYDNIGHLTRPYFSPLRPPKQHHNSSNSQNQQVDSLHTTITATKRLPRHLERAREILCPQSAVLYSTTGKAEPPFLVHTKHPFGEFLDDFLRSISISIFIFISTNISLTMSGIPVYLQSPINAAKKPSAITPQTTLPASQALNASNPTPTSATLSSTASYQPVQPGAASFPAPTGAAAQRYAPLRPTPTTKTETDDGPAQPQPGQVPVMTGNPTSSKAGEKYHPQQTPAPTTRAMPQPYPPQMAIPPPTAAIGGQPHSSTYTSNTASYSYPVSLPSSDDGASTQMLEHPPGYHQNVYASDLTSEQRRAAEASNSNASRGISERMGGEESDGVWNTLGKMAQQAGAKIAETESSIWRSINKEK